MNDDSEPIENNVKTQTAAKGSFKSSKPSLNGAVSTGSARSFSCRVDPDLLQKINDTMMPGETIRQRFEALYERDVQARTMTSGKHRPAKTLEEMMEELTQKVGTYDNRVRNMEMNFEIIVSNMNSNLDLFRRRLGIR